MYHEQSDDPAGLYNSEAIEKVFKNEDKAIDYIYDRIRDSHKEADEQRSDDEHVIKYEPDTNRIREGWIVEAWERREDDLYIVDAYKYDSYHVE
jgi:hypothetical protein